MEEASMISSTLVKTANNKIKYLGFLSELKILFIKRH